MKWSRIVVLVLAISVASVAAWNYFGAYEPAAKARREDIRNAGISVWTHYRYFVMPRILVYDLREVDTDKAQVDVFRALVQSAAAFKDRRFSAVVLQYRGKDRFVLSGAFFRQLGDEYGIQNPVYTLRTLPENVFNPDGTPAFGTWSGGLLGVLGKQMEDLNEFGRRWFLAEMASER